MPEQIQENKAQEQAIKTINGQVLLISCPGSGKTTTMLRRIDHMLDSGVPAEQILMVTFTDAAATEMKERFARQYNKTGVTFSTIHSLCLKVIMDGISSPLRIITQQEQYALLRDILIEVRLPATVNRKDILTDISAFKNSGGILASFIPTFIDEDAFKKIYFAYEAEKEKRMFVDFDDLLLICKKLLSENSKLLEKYQSRYRYIMVDEYQDTNNVQKDIIYLLAGSDGNLCVVGDDDQSIYGFRGANPRVMLDFEKDYSACKKIEMSINYRSRPEIINAAKDLIENNKERFPKDIQPFRDGHGSVIYNSSDVRADEINFMIGEIQKLHHENIPYRNMSILSRTNMQMDEIAAALEKNKIPYRSGDVIPDIYEHFIFSDILSYLRLINGDSSVKDLIRIINRPNRYVQESAVRNLGSASPSTILNIANSIFSEHKRYADELKKFYSQLLIVKEFDSVKEQVDGILDIIGYRRFLEDYAKRVDIPDSVFFDKVSCYIRELETHRFSDHQKWERYAFYHIAQHKEKLKHAEEDSISLSTMHRSKGLEWDVVFLTDCCQGTTPISKASTVEAIEEERRLFYVSVTRARERLYVLNYKNKTTGKKKSPVKPSIFIKELNGDVKRERLRQMQLSKDQEDEVKSVISDFEEGEPKRFQVGMPVHHKVFGEGVVVSKNLFFVNIRFGNQLKMIPIKK